MKYLILFLSLASCTKPAAPVVTPTPTPQGPVVLVGDSHTVMQFGKTLGEKLNAKRYGIVSASARTYITPTVCPGRCPYTMGFVSPSSQSNGTVGPEYPGLTGLISEWKPSTIIIELGTNDADNYSISGSTSSLETLLGQIGGIKCVWVGPPQYGNSVKNRYIDKMKTIIEKKCKFIDSREFPIRADAGDGVHFKNATGARWAELVWGNM